jgi:hypothetical protein
MTPAASGQTTAICTRSRSSEGQRISWHSTNTTPWKSHRPKETQPPHSTEGAGRVSVESPAWQGHAVRQNEGNSNSFSILCVRYPTDRMPKPQFADQDVGTTQPVICHPSRLKRSKNHDVGIFPSSFIDRYRSRSFRMRAKPRYDHETDTREIAARWRQDGTSYL